MQIVLAGVGQRHLVSPPGALDRQPVDGLGAGPALRGHQQHHRPGPAGGGAVLAGVGLDLPDQVVRRVESARQLTVYVARLVTLDRQHLVAVAAQQALQLPARDPGRDRRVGDLVAVEVQDRQDGAVVHRVDELVGVPGGGQRTGLELAVADHRSNQEVGVVHRGAVRVGEDVAELAALVDRARRLGRGVARDAAGEGELAKQPAQAVPVLPDAWVDLAVGALQVGVGHHRRPAVAGTRQEDGVDVALPDQPVEVGVEQVQTGRRTPMAQQARLDVVGGQVAFEQRVVEQVDLADGEIVRGSPPSVDVVEGVLQSRVCHRGLLRGRVCRVAVRLSPEPAVTWGVSP